MVISYTYSRREIRNLAIAIFLNSQFIRSILETFFPQIAPHGLRYVFIISIILMVASVPKFHLDAKTYLIPLVVILYYTMTQLLFPEKPAVSLFELVNYCLLPFFYAQVDVDFERVVKYSLILTAPAILVSNSIFSQAATSHVISMLLSYSVLFSVICSIMYLAYYRKQNGRHWLLYTCLSLIQMYFLFQLILFGSRGPVLSVFIFAVLLYYFRPDIKSDRVKSHPYRFFIEVTIIAVLFYLYSDELLVMIYNYSLRHDIFVRSIYKTYLLFQSNNVSHGRNDIFLLALKGWCNNPIFGNGLDMFEANTGIVYPHNLFFQLAYDGGIVLLLLIIVPIVVNSISLFRNNKFSNLAPWMVLFSSSVIGSLFSGDIWKRHTFWFFLAYCLEFGRRRAREIKINRHQL